MMMDNQPAAGRVYLRFPEGAADGAAPAFDAASVICRASHRDHAMILPDDAIPKPDGIFGKHTFSQAVSDLAQPRRSEMVSHEGQRATNIYQTGAGGQIGPRPSRAIEALRETMSKNDIDGGLRHCFDHLCRP
jgi:hypothetical protein